MPNAEFRPCYPTLFEVHLGISWSLFMYYLLSSTVTGRIHGRSLKQFFQDFLWLEAVGCAFCSWLCHRAEGSARRPSDSCHASTKEVLAVKAPLNNCTSGQGIVISALTSGEAMWCREWRKHSLKSKRCKLKCQLFHWLKGRTSPQFSYFNEDIHPQTFSQESIRQDMYRVQLLSSKFQR